MSVVDLVKECSIVHMMADRTTNDCQEMAKTSKFRTWIIYTNLISTMLTTMDNRCHLYNKIMYPRTISWANPILNPNREFPLAHSSSCLCLHLKAWANNKRLTISDKVIKIWIHSQWRHCRFSRHKLWWKLLRNIIRRITNRSWLRRWCLVIKHPKWSARMSVLFHPLRIDRPVALPYN